MMRPRPLLMGIVNVTPDSFSDGGRSRDASIQHALQLLEDGADILDIGGESTRPGAVAVSEKEECQRVVPVIKNLKKLRGQFLQHDLFVIYRQYIHIKRLLYEWSSMVNTIVTVDPPSGWLSVRRVPPSIFSTRLFTFARPWCCRKL